MEANKESDKAKLPYLGAIIIVALIVIGLWSVNLLLTYKWDDRGTFGDQFGAVNALFSGFAFAGVIRFVILRIPWFAIHRRLFGFTCYPEALPVRIN